MAGADRDCAIAGQIEKTNDRDYEVEERYVLYEFLRLYSLCGGVSGMRDEMEKRDLQEGL